MTGLLKRKGKKSAFWAWLWRVSLLLWVILMLMVLAFFTVDVTPVLDLIPSDWVRAALCSLLNPERKLYWQENPPVWPKSNSLIFTMCQTGWYAPGLLRPYLHSENPDLRYLVARYFAAREDDEATAVLEELLRTGRLPGADIYDEGRALASAFSLARLRHVEGFDYLAACLTREDVIRQWAQKAFLYSLGWALRFSPLRDDLLSLDRNAPSWGEAAQQWYFENREAIVEELRTLRGIPAW